MFLIYFLLSRYGIGCAARSEFVRGAGRGGSADKRARSEIQTARAWPRAAQLRLVYVAIYAFLHYD